MNFTVANIETMPVELFRRFGIACSLRLQRHHSIRGLKRALALFIRSLDSESGEKLKRDALNAATSIYHQLYSAGSPEWSIACTLACAAFGRPNGNLIGNFESSLEHFEGLDRREAQEVTNEILRSVLKEAAPVQGSGTKSPPA